MKVKNGNLPDYKKKQQLLYTEQRSINELIAYGDAFLKEARISDAIEFYQKAHHEAGLKTIKETAIKIGDTMLLSQACKALDQAPSDEDWKLIGNNARELKKYRFAMHAFEQSGHDDLLQEIKKIVKAEGNEELK